MFLHRPLVVFVSFFVLALSGLSYGVSLVAASPYPGMTQNDLAEERVYSPYAGRAYSDRVFFGDTHFHTNLSFDAGLVGTTLDVHDGFRMARSSVSTCRITCRPRSRTAYTLRRSGTHPER